MKKSHLLTLFSVTIIVGAIITFVATDIATKKAQKYTPYFHVVDITPLEDDPSVWGKNFPHQYESYLKTVDMQRTRYGGSEAMPRTPDNADPRSVVARSKLEKDPRLVTIWAGYPFSIDNRTKRGHAYMLIDQENTERVTKFSQPGTCLNCHASTYSAMSKLGDGDLKKGFEKLNALPYKEAHAHIKHPISCIDCHNPDDMSLHITKPAFMEGIKAYKTKIGVHDYDVNRDANHQEMRSFVCAQCHVEYYFKGDQKRLTYPWSEGIRADEILEYYKKNPHVDWIHTKTKTPALKAQHPEFEMWSQGVHAKSGVSCVDCHMPYQRVGAGKVTNHHVRSPLLNVDKACLTCHQQGREELLDIVHTIQSNHLEMRNQVMDALVELIGLLQVAVTQNRNPQEIKLAQQLHREAQFLIDFVEAENSNGFHAPQESARVMLLALDKIRKAYAILSPPAR